MNIVIEMGRLTRDPEVTYTAKNEPVAHFSIAVDRYNSEADFVNCVAFNRNADNIAKHFKKGKPIAVVGSLKVSKYTNRDGKTISKSEVYVDRFYFVPADKTGGADAKLTPDDLPDTFAAAVDDIPF